MFPKAVFPKEAVMSTVPVPHDDGFPVRESMTPRRRRRRAENDEYAAFVRRVLRAYAARVALGDIDAVADMVAISGEMNALIAEAVRGLRDKGYSWADVGQRLGVSRQAAFERWGKRVKG